jgi:hypothetical protein
MTTPTITPVTAADRAVATLRAAAAALASTHPVATAAADAAASAVSAAVALARRDLITAADHVTAVITRATTAVTLAVAGGAVHGPLTLTDTVRRLTLASDCERAVTTLTACASDAVTLGARSAYHTAAAYAALTACALRERDTTSAVARVALALRVRHLTATLASLAA